MTQILRGKTLKVCQGNIHGESYRYSYYSEINITTMDLQGLPISPLGKTCHMSLRENLPSYHLGLLLY